MRHIKTWISAFVIVFAVISGGVFIATFKNIEAQTSVTVEPAIIAVPEISMPLKVRLLSPKEHEQQSSAINIRGRIVSDGNVKLSASIPATVKEILFTQGQQVKKGDVLLRLSGNADAKHSLQLAYEQAQVNRDNLERTFKNTQAAMNIAIRQAEQQGKALDVNMSQLQKTLALTQNAGSFTVAGAQIGLENIQHSIERSQGLRERNASQIDLTGEQAKGIATLQAQNVARSLLTTLKGGYLPLVSGIKDSTDNDDFRDHEEDIEDIIDTLEDARDLSQYRIADTLGALNETLYTLLDINEKIASDVVDIVDPQAKPLADALKVINATLTNAVTVAVTQLANTKNQLEALPGTTGIQLQTLDSQVASLTDQMHSLQVTIDQAANASALQAQAINAQLQGLQQQKISANLGLESARIAAKAQSDSVSGQIDLVEKQVELAENALQQLTIISAIDGYITDVPVNVDEEVTPGRELVTIYATNILFVRAAIAPVDRVRIQVGDQAQLTVSTTETTEKITARVVRIAPVADTTGQIPVDLEFESTELPSSFVPGVTVQGQITVLPSTMNTQTSISVPLDAVILENSKSYLFVYEDGVAHKKEVILGPSSNDSVLIISGIDADEKIILTPNDVVDGTAVNPSDES